MGEGQVIIEGYGVFQAGAFVREVPGRAHIEASGRHRARFIHNMTTCEIKRLEAGSGNYGTTVDRAGKLVGQIFLDVEPEVIRIEVDALLREAIVAHWLHHKVADMIRFQDVDALKVVNVVGEGSASLLDPLCEGRASSLENHAWADTDVAGIACRLRRNDDRLALMGFDLTLPAEDASKLLEALVAHGASKASAEAFESWRVFQGVPADRIDMNGENIPLEAEHFMKALAWDKGCYIGQEVIARMHYRGKPNRHLRGLRIEGEAPKPGDVLNTLEGKEVGVVGSVTRDLDGGATIALGVVKRRFAESGTRLQTPSGASAEVVLLPFGKSPEGESSSSD